ncbi:UNKNOWN [Stylonychia lemnae]|uniref:Transmembrane protein n=1 Tax=Stylonychia lemnae TaxID=5949 RepID=A0A078BB89_STYLE|nr:UNKNOWN [Stylonychia lemnae]|eukprot:CDW90522.1 UNKNOWN [Stylonychia lemnae]
MIYHSFAHFEKSSIAKIPDHHLPIIRIVLAVIVFFCMILQGLSNPSGTAIYKRLFTDLEFYATFFAILGLLMAHRASKVPSDKEIVRTVDLMKKKNALIVNSIAIFLNIFCSLIYFVFQPIVYGARDFEASVKDSIFNSIAYSVALFSVLFHFACSRFALLDQDSYYILLVLMFWTAMNLLIQGNGLFFKDIKDDSLLIKTFLASFIMLASMCFYYLLTVTSQYIKGYKEKHEKHNLHDQSHKLIQNYKDQP